MHVMHEVMHEVEDDINFKVTTPCWNVIISNWKLPGSKEQPGGLFFFFVFYSLTRAISMLPTFLPPTVPSVTLNPHLSEHSPLAYPPTLYIHPPQMPPPQIKTIHGYPWVLKSDPQVQNLLKPLVTRKRSRGIKKMTLLEVGEFPATQCGGVCLTP